MLQSFAVVTVVCALVYMIDARSHVCRELVVNAAVAQAGHPTFPNPDFYQGVSVPLSRACSCVMFVFVSQWKQRVSYSQSHHLYDHTTTVFACDLFAVRLPVIARPLLVLFVWQDYHHVRC